MECFKIYFDDIEERIDPFFYCQDFLSIKKYLRNIKFPVLPLSELSKNIINGYDNRNFIKKGIPYLRVSNIRPNAIDINSIKFIPSTKISKDIKLKEGDILLTRKGSYGVSVTVSKELENYIISSEIFRIVIKKDIVNYKYISYWFNSFTSQKYFERIKSGAIMGHISQKALKSFKVPVPPMPIQQKIVDIMESAYSEKKQKEEEAKKLLASIDDYIMSELGIELPEVEDKKCFSVQVDELKGRLDPYYYTFNFKNIKFTQKLNLNKFEDFINVITKGETPLWRGDNYLAKGIPFFKVQNISNEGIKGNIVFISSEVHKRMKRSQLNGGEILFTMAGTIGIITIFPKDLGEANINQAIAKIIMKKGVNKEYLKAILNSSFCQLQIKRFLTTSAQPNINFEQIKSIIIPIDSNKNKQNKIADEVQNRIEKAKRIKTEAQKVIKKAQAEVEKIILGE